LLAIVAKELLYPLQGSLRLPKSLNSLDELVAPVPENVCRRALVAGLIVEDGCLDLLAGHSFVIESQGAASQQGRLLSAWNRIFSRNDVKIFDWEDTKDELTSLVASCSTSKTVFLFKDWQKLRGKQMGKSEAVVDNPAFIASEQEFPGIVSLNSSHLFNSGLVTS
jgi:hypothetical protein